MNMFDEARTIRGMIDMCHMTQSGIAKKLGTSQSYVANKLRLLRLSPAVQGKILECKLSERHARALLRLDGEEEMLSAICRIADRHLTVAETEALCDMLRECEAKKRLDLLPRLERLDSFDRLIENGLKSLISIGISATHRVSYYGNKKYITIAIEEENLMLSSTIK